MTVPAAAPSETREHTSRLAAVPEDRAQAPFTGWTREHWTTLGDDLLLAVRPFASPDHSHINLPGRTGGYGDDVDGLEGFARTFMLAAFRLTGEDGADPLGLAERYAAGFAAGTDPDSPRRWLRPDEHGQAMVEAAALAVCLDMTAPWIWDRMSPRTQQHVVDYLATCIGGSYPQNNWVWFRIVVETFLRKVGGPFSLDDIEADLATHDTFVRADGWFADGPERSYDYYAGWALHLYPVLWSRMIPDDPMVVARRPLMMERLDSFLPQAHTLVGADGGPLFEGRSLVYRFASAAPFWAGVLAGSDALTPGQTRRVTSGIVKHFTDRGVPDRSGLLTLGWHDEWTSLAQFYSGTGSPYWASKGLLGLALPADHPVWMAQEEALPVESGDVLTTMAAPGWLVSGTRADGVVRVLNHGTDHAEPGDEVTDSPVYARLGYSTVTSPVMGSCGWEDPVDQSVSVVDPEGRLSHRAGFETLGLSSIVADDAPGAVTAFSRARAHWVTPPDDVRDYGSGHAGEVRRGPWVTTGSVLRGAWELRLVRVDPTSDPEEVRGELRLAGWAVTVADDGGDTTSGDDSTSGDDTTTGSAGAAAEPARAQVTGGALRSEVVAVSGFDRAGVRVDRDVTALGRRTATPWLLGRPEAGVWAAALVRLAGRAGASDQQAPVVRLTPTTAEVEWQPGIVTSVPLPG